MRIGRGTQDSHCQQLPMKAGASINKHRSTHCMLPRCMTMSLCIHRANLASRKCIPSRCSRWGKHSPVMCVLCSPRCLSRLKGHLACSADNTAPAATEISGATDVDPACGTWGAIDCREGPGQLRLSGGQSHHVASSLSFHQSWAQHLRRSQCTTISMKPSVQRFCETDISPMLTLPSLPGLRLNRGQAHNLRPCL